MAKPAGRVADESSAIDHFILPVAGARDVSIPSPIGPARVTLGPKLRPRRGAKLMGGIMNTKRVVRLSAISLIVAVLWNPGLANRAMAAEVAPKQATLSETYRIIRADDVEFQKI